MFDEKDIQLYNNYRQMASMRENAAAMRALLERLEQDRQAQRSQYEETYQTMRGLNARLLEIQSSTAWRVIQSLWRLRLALFPRGSRRERWAVSILNAVRKINKRRAQTVPSPAAQEEAPQPPPAGAPAGVAHPLDEFLPSLPPKDAEKIAGIGRYFTAYADMWRVTQTTQPEQGPNYVPLTTESLDSREAPVKVVAFYLPQFHPFPENDEWWGRGFTEWTNVSKAVPQFVGHYQPHLPGELGFYDLRLFEVQKRQVELARQYGIHGFAFYYYWFNGKRLLERPLDQFLAHPELDFPFCLMWANENWTRRWDGMENDVLMAQVHTPTSDEDFIRDLEPYLRDPRYIRMDGRPVIMVYRPQIMPEPQKAVETWRKYCLKHGLGDPYVMAGQTFGLSDPRPLGFDAAVQFPPHNENQQSDYLLTSTSRAHLSVLNPEYRGAVFSYPRLARRKLEQWPDPPYDLYQTAFPCWDNEARKPGNGITYAFSTPLLYRQWLERICRWTLESNPPAQRFVFINAWNEWAEGTHLEPDRRYGYAYLQATADTLRALQRPQPRRKQRAGTSRRPARLQPPKNPLLLYSPGKADSSLLQRLLSSLGLEHEILTARFLNKLERLEVEAGAPGIKPATLPDDIQTGRQIRAWLDHSGQDVTWNIICVVREPVGLNLSEFLQEAGSYIPNFEARAAARDVSLQEMQEMFSYFYDHVDPGAWFETQVAPLFGIDVFASPFQRGRGWQVYENRPYRLLVLRGEDLLRALPEAMQAFLGLENVSLDRLPGDTIRPELYHAFEEKPLPAEYIHPAYETRFARHFYSPAEINWYAFCYRNGRVLDDPRVASRFLPPVPWGRPVSVDLQPPETTRQARWWVDGLRFRQERQLYELWGWAFLTVDRQVPPGDYRAYIALRSDSRSFLYPAEKTARPDVQAGYAELGLELSQCGFSALVDADTLELGRYRLELLFHHPQTGRVYAVDTNCWLERTLDLLVLEKKKA